MSNIKRLCLRKSSSGQTSHELLPRIHLQQFETLAKQLKNFRDLCKIFGGQRLRLFVKAGDIKKGQRVFVNFPAARKLVMLQIKKFHLVVRVTRLIWDKEHSAEWGDRSARGLFDEPLLGGLPRDFHGVR